MSVSSASAQTLVASKPSVVIGAASSSVSPERRRHLRRQQDRRDLAGQHRHRPERLLAVVLPYRSPGHHPGLGARHAHLLRRLPEDRLPRLQRHLRHRPPQRGPGHRRGRRRRVRLRLQGRGRRVPGRSDHLLDRGRRRPGVQPRRDRDPGLRRDEGHRARAQGPGLGHDEDLLLRRQHRGLQQGLRQGHPRGRPGHHPRRRRLRRVQGPPQRLVHSAEGPELADFAYGPESYDATILAALAALKGGDTTPQTIQKNLAAVSGSTDGDGVRLVRRVCRADRGR